MPEVVVAAAVVDDVEPRKNSVETTMRVNGNDVGLRASEWAWLVLILISILFLATESRAETAKQKGITKAAFDRGHYRYHGRIKALADAAREGGLQF